MLTETEKKAYCALCQARAKTWLDEIKNRGARAFTWVAYYPTPWDRDEYGLPRMARRNGDVGRYTAVEAMNLTRNGYRVVPFERVDGSWFHHDVSDEARVHYAVHEDEIHKESWARWQREQDGSPDYVGSDASGYGRNTDE